MLNQFTFAASFLKNEASKPVQQAAASSTSATVRTAAAGKDFRTGEPRMALSNVTNKVASTSSSKSAAKKSKISSTQSHTSKVNHQAKPSHDDAPRRKSSLTLTTGRRKDSRVSISAMEIETAGVNQSVDMGDADTSQAVFVDEEEEEAIEGRIELVESAKEEEEVAAVEEASIVTVPREKILLPIGCTNIDEVDENDPQWVTDYVNSIFTYLRENEVRLRIPHHNYMEVVQTNLTPSMRGILVDWLVEVAEEYELSSETLFLAVNYLDRFAATCPVDRRKFQLVGVACMLIASKYEGIFAPAVDEFVYISANTYSREEVLLMEVAILNALNFTLTAATPKVFLRRYLKAASADLTLAFLASYLCEISLLEYSFLQYLPSMVAAASVFLALRTLGREPWSPTLEFYTSYRLQDPTFQQCVRDLYQLQSNAPKGSLQAIHEKYAHTRFQKVSKIAPPQVV